MNMKVHINSRFVRGSVWLFLWVFPVIQLFSQNTSEFQGLPFITNYPATVYEAGIQNWDITQDNMGRIFIANNLGLLEYDGRSWQRYGLNNTKVRSALFGQNGRIYVGSQGDFGFLQGDPLGELTYVSLADSLDTSLRDFDETWKVFAQGDQVYFCTFKRVYIFEKNELRTVDSPKRLDISFQVENQIYTQIPGEGLNKLTETGFEVVLNGDFFADKRISNILAYDRNRWLISTFSNGLFLYDGQIKPFPLSSSFWKNEYLINYSTRLKDGGIALGTQNAGVFILDQNGQLRYHLDKESGLMDLTIHYIFEDDQQGLWLAMNNGLARIDLVSPFTRIDDRLGLTGSGYAALKKGNTIYLGTNNGLFLWENGNISIVEGTEGQVYSVQDIRGKVIVGHNNGAMLIENRKAIPLHSAQGAWIFKQVPSSPSLLIQGTYSGLNLFEWRNDRPVFLQKIEGFDESSRVMEFEENTLWVAHGYKGVYRIKFSDDFKKVEESVLYNSAQGFPNDELINVYKIANQLIFTANGGFYKYEAAKDRFFPWDEFNDLFGYGTRVADLEGDELGNIYFIEEDRLGVIKSLANGKKQINSKSFNKIKRLWNDDLANVIVLNNQNILIGGKEGFIHYNPQKDLPRTELPKVFFKEITNHGKESKGLFFGHKSPDQDPSISLDRDLTFSQNSFLFEFSSPHFESSGMVQYQVMLENYDAEWSPWTTESRKEYTNLREGDYVFWVKSKNIFEEESEPIAFSFTIKPPIYRSLGAYVIYTILIVAGLWMGFMFLDKRYKKKTKAIEIEKNRALQKKESELEDLTQRTEEEIIKLKNSKLEAEINFKNQELTSSAMHLIQKNKLLQDIKNSLKNLSSEEKNKQLNSQLNRLVKSIDKDLEGGEEWALFSQNFDQVHGNFITRLKERYPDLTPQEIKFSAYIRMNLNTKEIANLLGISVRGVEIGRYRVRKKLGLERQENLSDFLLRF
ncbi:triple tyrosine motif-containing protein [Algoriphagus mannitolivorans]|uniref:triple tyrosine motif-containing protein n=1 Tax=Algoriphagus mannitolivorans TaxID=226504 RepID=UPI000A0218ED|nr:triple tyrosine motif-containing protein [Algoriphagus mannitolivorans]